MKFQRIRERRSPPSRQEGVMLLEALVAVLIFSLGIIALMGMQANSIVQVSQSKYRTDASYLANQVISRMWVDQTNIDSYASASYAGRLDWNDLVAKTLPSGTATIAVSAAGAASPGKKVTVTVNWRQPDDTTTRKYMAVANINASNAP